MAIAFDTKLLRFLSPDSDDYEAFIIEDWRNQENMLEGILLYPRKGMSKACLYEKITDFIENKDGFSHASLEIGTIHKLGEDWAVPYQVSAFYNHFDLPEEF